MSWAPPAPTLQHGTLQGYRLTWRQVGGAAAPTTRSLPASRLSLQLAGLLPYTRYAFSLLAHNKLGPGPASLPEVVARTKEDGKDDLIFSSFY